MNFTIVNSVTRTIYLGGKLDPDGCTLSMLNSERTNQSIAKCLQTTHFEAYLDALGEMVKECVVSDFKTYYASFSANGTDAG